MFRRVWVAALAAVLGGSLASCADPGTPPNITVTALGRQPNIVFVLTDDLSNALLPYLPHVQAMARAGTTFSDYTVSDSFCCPSRSSIFTGNFPHDTGVFTNNGWDGGFHVFHDRGEEKHTFATALQAVGYRTAMMGKYLNGYQPAQRLPGGSPFLFGGSNGTWVPPGWDEWDVGGEAYHEYNYDLNENGHAKHYGRAPEDYLTDVISAKGQDFITTSADEHKPFFLELSTFSPHRPATPAPQDVNSFPGLAAPHGPAWNRTPTNAPDWLRHLHITPNEVPDLNRVFRKQVQSVQSVDRMLGDLEQTLRKTGQAGNTIVVFSSDNGFHNGQYGLYPGKLTAFDTDIQVPLIVTGPHIPAGRVDSSVVQNIDLAPTFEQIGGATVASNVDGHSMVPLLLGRQVPWRTTALVEHHGPDLDPNDPDVQDPRAGNPPTYDAIRTQNYTYVRYRNGEREYYDHVRDPYQLDNRYATLAPARVAALNSRVDALTSCHDGAACWTAGAPRLAS